VVDDDDDDDANTHLVRRILFYYSTEQNLINSYFNSLISSDANCTYEIKQKIVMAKAAFNKKIFSPLNRA
jgi:hypothetical protein